MVEVDKSSWEEHVTNAQGWVIVDFWSPKCEPCMELKPAVEQIALRYADYVKICSLDITKARRLAIQQKVMGLPVIAFYHNGEKKAELKGEVSPEDIENKLQEMCIAELAAGR